MTMITETQSFTGFSGSFFSSVRAVLAAVNEALLVRRTLHLLGELDDHALRDIGLTRSDLFDLHVASSPIDAIATLVRIRRTLRD